MIDFSKESDYTDREINTRTSANRNFSISRDTFPGSDSDGSQEGRGASHRVSRDGPSPGSPRDAGRYTDDSRGRRGADDLGIDLLIGDAKDDDARSTASLDHGRRRDATDGHGGGGDPFAGGEFKVSLEEPEQAPEPPRYPDEQFGSHRSHREEAPRDYDTRSEGSYGGHRPRLSHEEVEQQKREIMYQFERLEKKGVFLPKKMTMDMALEDMKYEYEKIRSQRETDNAVKFYRNALMAVVSGAEYVNDNFSPYKLKLNGWSEGVMENADGYDDVFEELHHKYNNKMKIPPELKLMGMVVGSGFMCHFTNSVFKSSNMPEMGDIMKDNPDLMRQFQAAAVNTAQRQNPMMGGIFDMMNSMGASIPNGPPPPQPSRAPPAPVQRREMQGPSNVDDILNSFSAPLQTSRPPQSTPAPVPQAQSLPSNPPRGAPKDDDAKSLFLSEINEFDRVSEISSLDDSMIKDSDLRGMKKSMSRPGMGIRATHRESILNRVRRKRQSPPPADGGLVIEV